MKKKITVSDFDPTRLNPLMLPNIPANKITGNVWRPAACATSSALSSTPSCRRGNDTITDTGTSPKCPKGHPLIQLIDNCQIPETILKVSSNETTISAEVGVEKERKADEIVFGCGVCETQLILSQQSVSVCNVCSLFLCSRCAAASATDKPTPVANESLTHIITPEHTTTPQRPTSPKSRSQQRLRNSWTKSSDNDDDDDDEIPRPSYIESLTNPTNVALGLPMGGDSTEHNYACGASGEMSSSFEEHVGADFVHSKHSHSHLLPRHVSQSATITTEKMKLKCLLSPSSLSSPPSTPRLRAHRSTDDDDDL